MSRLNPEVSIIMPAYNAGKYIEESIQSVLNQTHQNWELLIVNDGSTDNTQIIAESYAAKDPRVKLINQVNSRLGAARNKGIQNALGDWIAFLDSDDLWTSLKLEKQMLVSKEFPDVDMIYTDGWVFHDGNFNNLIPYSTITGKYTSENMYVLEYETNYIPVLSAIVKKDMVNKVGFQEEIIQCCEDWDYWLRMAINGATFYGINEKLFYYRRHDSNMSSNSVTMRLAQASILIKNYYPSYITLDRVNTYLKPLINTLLLDLVSASRKEDAFYLIDEHSKISPSNNYYIHKKCIEILGKHAVLPIRVINKINSVISN